MSRHLAALRGSSGYDVVGATVHGGPSGIGYRGDDHLAIFEAAGLSIAEVIGLESHSPMPVVRPGASGASWSEGFWRRLVTCPSTGARSRTTTDRSRSPGGA